MAVSLTPSRLVTLGESTLEESAFLGLFCESSGLRPRVDSSLIKSRLLNKILGQLLVKNSGLFQIVPNCSNSYRIR